VAVIVAIVDVGATEEDDDGVDGADKDDVADEGDDGAAVVVTTIDGFEEGRECEDKKPSIVVAEGYTPDGEAPNRLAREQLLSVVVVVVVVDKDPSFRLFVTAAPVVGAGRDEAAADIVVTSFDIITNSMLSVVVVILSNLVKNEREETKQNN